MQLSVLPARLKLRTPSWPWAVHSSTVLGLLCTCTPLPTTPSCTWLCLGCSLPLRHLPWALQTCQGLPTL